MQAEVSIFKIDDHKIVCCVICQGDDNFILLQSYLKYIGNLNSNG